MSKANVEEVGKFLQLLFWQFLNSYFTNILHKVHFYSDFILYSPLKERQQPRMVQKAYKKFSSSMTVPSLPVLSPLVQG